MPIYTYECPGCGPFEEVVSVADRAEAQECPGCATPGHRRNLIEVLCDPRQKGDRRAMSDRQLVSEGLR